MPEHREELAPGVYSTPDGTLHLDLAEMCLAAGYEPTEENQHMLELAARELFDGCTLELDDEPST